jgi:hypothetical protein
VTNASSMPHQYLLWVVLLVLVIIVISSAL